MKQLGLECVPYCYHQSYMLSHVPSLVACQCIITFASVQYPLESWLNYNVQFWTLTVSYPLQWDICHINLVIGPCPHCGVTTHYPNHCPFCSYPSRQAPYKQWDDNSGQHIPHQQTQSPCYRDFNYAL